MIAATSLSNLALPASAVLTGPILARTLGVDGRGELAAITAPLTFAAYFFTMGLPEALTFRTATKATHPRSIIWPALVAGVASGVLASAAIFLLAPILLRTSPALVPILQSVGLLMPVILAITALRGILQGSNGFTAINAERWTSVVGRLVFILLFAVLGWISVVSALLITQFTAILGGGALVVMILRTPRSGPGDRARFRSEFPPLVSYGGRVWVGSLSTLLILRLDQVLMVPLTTEAQLGLYAVAVAVAELPSAAYSALRDIMFSRATTEDGPVALAFAARVGVVAYLPATAVFFLVAPALMRFAFGDDFSAAAPIAEILWIGTLPAGIAGVCGAGLLGLGRPGVYSIAQAVVALINTGFVIVLVPTLGGTGAAIASLASYCMFAAVATVLISRRSGLPARDFWLVGKGDLGRVRQALRHL